MQGVNKVIIAGRLGKDPELKVLPNGNQVCSFSLATSDSWVKDGQKQERTEWHRVVAWGKTAEICGKYLKKGSSTLIEGKLATRSWDDPQGQKRYVTEIIAESMQFLDSKKNDGDSQSAAPTKQSGGYKAPQGSSSYVDDDNDVPFNHPPRSMRTEEVASRIVSQC
jgi:single-strand DNA-binding protein